MKPKDLAAQFSDDAIPALELGNGDTVFSGGKQDGRYFLTFRLLDEPVEPGTNVGLEKTKKAKPYFEITFSNIESLRVLAGVVSTMYEAIKQHEELAEGFTEPCQAEQEEAEG